MRKKRICCVILALMLILCENFQMIYAKDNEAEKYDRGDWIQQHMDYSMSEQYTKEIVRGFRGSLYQAVSEIKNDKLIRGYSTLDAVNKVMDYDLDLSKKDEYQLLLAQILFSYEGAASIEEVYMQNMANAFIKIGELIEMYDAADNLIDNDQLNAILDMLRSAESVKKINEACEKFIDFTGDEKFDKLISDDWIDYFDECKYLTNVLVSYLKEIRNGSKKTFQEIALYVATGEAYAKTSDTFGDILLYMRKNIDIPSDEERFQPIATSNLVSDQMILNLIGADGVKFANVLDTPVVLKDMAEALEEFYDSIQNYRDQNSQKIIDIVVENFRESNKNFVFKIGSHTVDAFLNCLPIFSQYEQLKSLFSTGQAIIDLFTSIDDEQYLENMVLKLYCISYIEYLAVDSIASNKSGWTTGAIKIENGIASMENTGKMTEEELEDYQFQRASTFDEAVGVYKSISLVAIDYARKYYFTLRSSENMSFFRNRNKIKEYDEILQKLNDQKQEINKIHCHTVKVDKDEAMGDAGNISELIKNIRADKGESNEGETNKENANEGDIYERYRTAAEKNSSAGNWREELHMTGNMNLVSSDQKEKLKAKVTLDSTCDVHDYDANNLSALKISGSGAVKAAGESMVWTVDYADGVAHYQYTEPVNTSADVALDPICFQFDTLTREMMKNASVTGNTISFTISGDYMTQVASEAMNMLSGVENLEIGAGDVKVYIDEEKGNLSAMNMIFHASMEYMGYQAKVDYNVEYQFTPLDQSDETEETNQEKESEIWRGQADLSKVPEGAGEYQGHYYYAYDVETVTTWEEAKQYCEQMGGYLASVTSREEDEFLYSYLQNNFQYESAYFGFTDQEEEGIWKWSNGEESSYTNWHEGEPNGENSEEDFAMYYYKYPDGSWNDGDFGNATVNSGRVFICEWGPYQVA